MLLPIRRLPQQSARFAGSLAENDMNTITKRTIALTLAAAAGLASITPSLAREVRGVGPQVYMEGPAGTGAYAYGGQNHLRRGYDAYGAQYRYGSEGFANPSFLNSPTQCWTDDGYGRRATCDGGTGGN
jgi:hypothetical protein